MEKEPHYLKLPDAGQGGAMVLINVDDIISMSVPEDSTLVDENTGIVYKIEVLAHTHIFVKSDDEEKPHKYHIPLPLKDMIFLVNSNMAYMF